MAASILSENVEEIKQTSPLPLAELNAVLADFEPLAAKVTELKKETLKKEAQVLAAILERVTPLVPILSKDYELYYRHEIVIITNITQVPLEQNAYFYSENKLILYENGSLVRMHRYGEFAGGHRPGWELIEEHSLTASSAAEVFGLNAIAAGIVRVLKEASEIIILTEELEARLMELTKVLEVLQ